MAFFSGATPGSRLRPQSFRLNFRDARIQAPVPLSQVTLETTLNNTCCECCVKKAKKLTKNGQNATRCAL